MKLRIRTNQMEEVEGLHNEFPYAFHHVDLSQTLIPWHWHEALEFDYVVSGSVQVSTAGQTLTFTAGEGFFINSNIITTMIQKERCIIDSHLFHPIFLAGHFKSVFETKYLNPVTQNRNLDLFSIRGNTQEEKALLGKLTQLSQLQSQTDVEFQTRNLVSEIWLLLLEALKHVQLERPGSRKQDRILSMVAFLQENFTEKLTLEDIAAAASVSPRECLRCFREAIGKTPMEYLTDYRIHAAQKLLQNTDLPISDIALNTGWGSSSYFAKIFHRQTGKTPNACRKEAQNLKKSTLEQK